MGNQLCRWPLLVHGKHRESLSVVHRYPASDGFFVLTYTQANQEELRSRLKEHAGDHHNIEVMGWFSFLLSHFAKPFFPFKFSAKCVHGFGLRWHATPICER